VLQRRVNLHRLDKVPAAPRQGGRELFMQALRQGLRRAGQATTHLQSGRLQNYLLLLILTAVLAGALPFLRGGSQAGPSVAGTAPGLAFMAVWAIGLAATLGTVWLHRRRLVALLLMGATGLVVSLAFVHFSAPDLALTQLLVEMTTIILMMLALHWLPEAPSARDPADSSARRWRDAVIAIAAGLGVAALIYMVLGRPFESISPYFLETSVALGGGANAVNVIIVDYRGFDTLGEITVMGIAALIIHALLAGWRPAQAPPALAPMPADSHPLVLALVARLLLPLTAMVSIFLFLRGHNLPGGGFIAGLVLAIGLTLQFVASGQAYVDERLPVDYRGWVGWGLLIGGACGIGSVFFGAPFLTSSYDYPLWPLVGAVPLASASLFDLGVFLTVVGATMVALLAMSRLSGAPSLRETGS
jgi:multicomponent K+:H+ antiporter subunit A